jgi:hypothetical protein
MALRTQEQRDAKRKTLFEKEHIALQQAETHWKKASNAWEAKNPFLARRIECRAKEAECRAARCRSQQEMLNWEEDQGAVVDEGDLDAFEIVPVPTLDEEAP